MAVAILSGNNNVAWAAANPLKLSPTKVMGNSFPSHNWSHTNGKSSHATSDANLGLQVKSWCLSSGP